MLPDRLQCLAYLLWLVRFVPTLKTGLPPLDSFANTLLSLTYAVSLVGCFAAIVTLATGIAFGVLPALRAGRVDSAALAEGARSGGSPSRNSAERMKERAFAASAPAFAARGSSRSRSRTTAR